jgi:PAT family beta-lactamase induction signal transducer AmpG
MLYLEPRLWIIFLLGFSSGLPLALTAGTLTYWLAETGISNTSIGLFALVGVPYTFKFVWSPLVDRMSLPGFTRLFGRRRGWMLLSQLALAAAMFAMSLVNPAEAPATIAAFALLLAFLSATQDIVIDAYRVDILDEKLYGAGAATVVFGYRIGMLASSAGALYLAHFYSWQLVYQTMAGLMGVGLLATVLGREPVRSGALREQEHNWLYNTVIAPFADFMTRPAWVLILAFVVFYKLGDVFVASMTSPFYLAMGFSKIEIANITKVFGVVATLLGSFLGGWVVSRFGILKGLLICGTVQLLSNFAFMAQAYAGYDLTLLVFTIGVENIAGGMGTAALVAYLSKLCNASFTATQYALLSSLTAVGRTFLAAPCGVLADTVSWPVYFGISGLIALPGMLLLLVLIKQPKQSS